LLFAVPLPLGTSAARGTTSASGVLVSTGVGACAATSGCETGSTGVVTMIGSLRDVVAAWDKVMNLDRFDVA
jgi:hypothetical protein